MAWSWRVSRAADPDEPKLGRQETERKHGNEQGLFDEQPEVGSHADRNEEQPQQQALEWLDVGLKLVAIFAIGEQDTGYEGSERHR